MTPLLRRAEFPYYSKLYGDRVYLDSAATALKPYQVVYAVEDYLQKYTANVHRQNGAGNVATARYESARVAVARFIHAAAPENIIFTSGTTHSINMIANSRFARGTIIITDAEHNSNILPWLLTEKHETGELVVFETEMDCSFDLEKFTKLVRANKGALVSVTHVSNVTGVAFPIKEIVEISHQHDCLVLVDGAQAVAHTAVNVTDLNVDFYAFSAHKMYGPTGLGILYAKPEHLAVMRPQAGGGGMVAGQITFDSYRLADIPHRFEAGTPNIEGAVGLAGAIEWIEAYGIQTINNHVEGLYNSVYTSLEEFSNIRLIGGKGNIISFTSDTLSTTDIGMMLTAHGIICRTGTLCASPYLKKFNTNEVVRLSFGPYNNSEDIKRFHTALTDTLQTLK